jgi:hypothetical protein
MLILAEYPRHAGNLEPKESPIEAGLPAGCQPPTNVFIPALIFHSDKLRLIEWRNEYGNAHSGNNSGMQLRRRVRDAENRVRLSSPSYPLGIQTHQLTRSVRFINGSPSRFAVATSEMIFPNNRGSEVDLIRRRGKAPVWKGFWKSRHLHLNPA